MKPFHTTQQVRAMLKAQLGINSKQASVKAPHSLQYLTITVRDAAVDLKAVRKFAASIHTWTMDITDYVEGQSIHVETTKAVDDVHRAPFMGAAMNANVPEGDGQGVEIVPGILLWSERQNCYVSDRSGNRGTYLYRCDIESRQPWAIEALALHIANLVALAA